MKTSNKLLLVLLVVALTAITAFIGTAKHYHMKGASDAVKGDGNRATEARTIPEFTGISIKGRIEIQLTQGTDTKVAVNAAKNIVPLVSTEVINGILTVTTKSRINENEKIVVDITVPAIQSINMSEGAFVETTHTFTGDKLTVNSNSGSNGRLNLQYMNLSCQLSTGSELDLDGSAEEASLEASTGANIQAGDLSAKICRVEANTGANATVNASQELIAEINTGSVLNYRGDPAKTDINSSTGGTVRKR